VRRALLAVLLAVAALGCGEASEVRERDLISKEPAAPAETGERSGTVSGGIGRVRIAVVTHGQASSQFWLRVRNGLEDAARQMNASVEYRSPDTFSVARMRELIEQAIAARPDGLIVSLPSAELVPVVRRAARAGIPVVSINSGSDVSQEAGALAHVGQLEYRAGRRAGERLAAAGARRVLCLNQEIGNEGLDLRCRGLALAMRRAGGDARVVPISDDDRAETQRAIVAALESEEVDGVLTLSSNSAEAVLAALRATGRRGLELGTFDLSPQVLESVRTGRITFAVEQQPYLQGYIPVVALAQRARYGLFPAQGDVIPTGPSFVTRDNAAQAIRLSRRGIR
jgi:simple sugar transport system substrate-binding protein